METDDFFAFAQIPTWLLELKKFTPSEKIIYGTLLMFAGEKSEACPSIRLIATSTGLKERHVRRIIKNLESENLIRIENRTDVHGRKDSNVYTFLEGRITDNNETRTNRIAHNVQDVEIKTSEYRRGIISNGLRLKVMKRDGFHCQLCGATGKTTQLVIDHIYPVSKGGKSVFENLQTLCSECNSGKSDDFLDDNKE